MDILPKIFIKDYKNTDNSKVRNAYGSMCGIFGIVTNMIICTLKIVIGLIINSIAIVADGINNLADAGSSILTLVGFKISSRPSDKEHPFGHERMEYVTGLIVSLIIIAIGLLLLESSINKLITSEVMAYEPFIAYITLGILLFAIILKLWQSFFYKKYGKLIDSKALIATSADSLNDVISTTAVLISLVVSIFYPNSWVDGVMGILVSLFIIISGIKLVKETISPLIGEVPSKEFIHEIKEKVMNYDGVLGIHDLVVHSYGPKKVFITLHVEVDSKVNINKTHDMIDNIENDFRINENINMVIHMDPVDIDDEEVIMLRSKLQEILPLIDKRLMFHDLRVVKGITHTNIIFDILKPFDCTKTEEEIEAFVLSRLKEVNENYRTVITFDIDYSGGQI